MSSQETPAASSSRGTAIPLDATAAVGDHRLEDIDSALQEPSTGALQIMGKIDDPEGLYRVSISAPQHDLHGQTVPQVPVANVDLQNDNTVNQQYEVEFQRLERELASEDDLEDYNNTDNDDDEDEDVTMPCSG